MIHSKAVIESGAVLGNNVEIGPYAVIEKGVKLGNGVIVNPNAHIKGNTEIGDSTFIGTGAIIGENPQDIKFKDFKGKVRIGANNTIREYVNIHVSTAEDRITSIGDNNFIMAFAHIAHDVVIHNHVIICNGTLIAGHCDIADRAVLSGNVVVHQFVRIGRMAMVGGLSRVNQDIAPFMMVVGDSRVWGLNIVGLKRAGIILTEVNNIKKAFNLLYRKGLALPNALAQMEKIESAVVKEIVEFIKGSQRGICGPQKNSFWERLFLDYPYLVRTQVPAYDNFLKNQTQQSTSFKYDENCGCGKPQ